VEVEKNEREREKEKKMISIAEDAPLTTHAATSSPPPQSRTRKDEDDDDENDRRRGRRERREEEDETEFTTTTTTTATATNKLTKHERLIRRGINPYDLDPPPSCFVRAIERAIKCFCYGVVLLYLGKEFHRNVCSPLMSLSNADYTFKTVVRDVFYGYEKPKHKNAKAASSVKDVERKTRILADENHLKRKLEQREKKRQKLHEKLGLNHEIEMEIWRKKMEQMKKIKKLRDHGGEL
jgi:hypothetical protein